MNGGEHSMLSAFDHLSSSAPEIVALAPTDGPLGVALRERGFSHVPLILRDESNTRLPRQDVLEHLRRSFVEIKPDLVHANSLAVGRLTGAIAARTGVPCIAHLRDIIRLSKAAVADLNENRLLLAVSDATKSFHVSQGMNEDRVRVLFNGVDCQRFLPRPSTGELKRQLGIPADQLLVTTIGQIGLRKGQDVLATAAALVADEVPNVHYLLVGERYSQKQESIDFERTVIQRFQQSGLNDRLHCLGYRDDVPFLMNESDLLVHPAHQEPLGRVLLESAACGLAVVATRVGGTEEIFTDQVSASLVPPAEPVLLAGAIIELCRDTSQRGRFAQVARDTAEKNFDVKAAAKNLETVWKAILEASSLGLYSE
jgi:glycosyltransferase involved in cell wall biosynthesis